MAITRVSSLVLKGIATDQLCHTILGNEEAATLLTAKGAQEQLLARSNKGRERFAWREKSSKRSAHPVGIVVVCIAAGQVSNPIDREASPLRNAGGGQHRC